MTVKLCERLLHDIHYFHGKKIIIKALLYYEVRPPKTTDAKIKTIISKEARDSHPL